MRVGLFGATGQVGGVMLRILDERDFPVDELRLFASARSAGRTIAVEGQRAHRRGRRHARYDGPRPRPVLRRRHRVRGPCAERVAAAGATVIDNSSAWRMDPDVPLVVPEVNAARPRLDPQGHRRQPELHDDGRHAGAQAARHRAPGSRRWSVSTYQAVSGGGLAGVAELDEQVRKVADRRRRAHPRRPGRRLPGRRQVPRARSRST